ncbi:GNAT family N-acetyltransferase [Pelomonas sp. APW6]|uniref:GNAT family N-acetyltransferase n=1 Tax=Roseateles subflavus TaxID=3053353 RepID=A0ABT7LCI5_9BURK|nr:GNAT family N-acetyltransferase [Pelomonas sp. APW6]MDL5030576.1 GNAT family N-acetyltransferase [Pelomonas sp. APW6]
MTTPMPTSTPTPLPATSALVLRAGHAGDAEAIGALIASLAPAFFLSPDGAGTAPFLASVSAAAEAGYLADPRYRFWLLTDGADEPGALAGFIASRDGSHLFHLFIAPAWQGRGLARQLWQAMHTAAIDAGHRGGFTVNASLNAVPVYARFGFVPEGEVQRVHGVAYQPMRHPGPVR